MAESFKRYGYTNSKTYWKPNRIKNGHIIVKLRDYGYRGHLKNLFVWYISICIKNRYIYLCKDTDMEKKVEKRLLTFQMLRADLSTESQEVLK